LEFASHRFFSDIARPEEYVSFAAALPAAASCLGCLASSYNSGLPFEIDGPADTDFLAQQYGTRILERVNFDRGRIRPSSLLDISGGAELVHSEKIRLHLQADVFNLANRLNLINFAGVFSGTALDVSRSFTLRLRSEF
jgi:hypothetical protein